MIFFAAPLATIIEQAPLDIRKGFRSKCGKASAKAILGISLFLPSPLSLSGLPPAHTLTNGRGQNSLREVGGRAEGKEMRREGQSEVKIEDTGNTGALGVDLIGNY